MAAESASGIPLELIALVTPLPADGGPVPGEIIEHTPSATPQSSSRTVASCSPATCSPMSWSLSSTSAAPISGRLRDGTRPAARHVEVVVPGHGAAAEGPEVAARLSADHAYIDSLRRGQEPVDARLGPDAEWLSGAHQSNLEQVRGR
jgi:hypothetical protein